MNAYRKSLGLLFALTMAALLPGEARAETLDSLIARHIEARGGLERLQSIETIRMRGRAIAGPGREALITREARPPGRIRTEFVYQGVTSIYACDGSRCWSVAPLSGNFDAQPMSEADASRALAQADIIGPLVDWKAKGHSVLLAGRETIDGREVFKLELSLKGGGAQTDYLDAETALLVRREATRTVEGRTVEIETTFDNFGPVGGVIFPFSIKTGAKNQPDFLPESLEIVVEGAELNVVIDESRFRMPG
jgi:hypothetical protein